VGDDDRRAGGRESSFYRRFNELLREHGFDDCVEAQRRLFGAGTPRALQGRVVGLGALLGALWPRIDEAIVWIWRATRRRHQPGASTG
jgi:hypothetical protein